ncbi:MAG: RNA polymerase sigma factor [Oscillospiraceae bacterium]|nr:RNA polymerase sigma factor [Oscillospiraceae bacterium]
MQIRPKKFFKKANLFVTRENILQKTKSKDGDDLIEIENLIDEHGKAIYNFCFYLTGNKHDADDLFQDTFLIALEKAAKIDRQGNPKSYLLSIAANLRKNAVKKNARRNRLAPTVETDLSELYEVADTNSLPEDIVLRKMERDALCEVIDRLPDSHKIPIILFYREQAKISEIAVIIKKPEGTVKRLLHEAKGKIKNEMEMIEYGR